ncbi:MAG: 2Fe-2S iron-sulfur cluster-binding protein [Planctomycetota bacterium]|nr:2Fe-2S iron-sulfur cluster-binding protein [Planctomycetota bacterium]
MPTLTIDNRRVDIPSGGTVLDAAWKLRIDIPTMCFLEGVGPNVSCMLCVVKVEGRAGLVPACATPAEDGMRIRTDTEEVRQARTDALELLLSDHLGDCEGPCRLACPFGINIPLVLRQIASGKISAAPSPDVAPEIPCDDCPAPCRRACRRRLYDAPVAIPQLMRYAAGAGLAVLPSKSDVRRRFSVHIGRLLEGEIEQFISGASRTGRVAPTTADLTAGQARDEAIRCLHCDCRKSDTCKLRNYSEMYGAKAGRYKGQRKQFERRTDHPDIIFEPGKCISCGLCVAIAEAAGEELGLTFVGRGFDVHVAVPFDRFLADALKKSARRCAEACPTGALSLKDE